jgi:hypothetical protein
VTNPYAPPTASPEPPKPKPAGSAAQAGSVIGAVIGVVGSRYFGALLLVPGLGMILGAVLVAKLGPARAKPMIAAWAVQFGHLCWMVVGGLLGGMFGAVAVDVAVLVVGLTWLVLRPGVAPAVLLGLYQVALIGLNAMQLASASETEVKALILHLVLRVGAIALLVLGVVTLRRSAAAAT